jgi:hypothetical protein
MKLPIRRSTMLPAAGILGLILVLGCGHRRGDDILAKVGSHELTRRELSAFAGLPAESLGVSECRRWVDNWIEGELVAAEAKKRKLDHDGEIVAKLATVRTELYRAKMLADMAAPPPNDSAVAVYYAAHRQEFLRSGDAYLLELYWAEHRETIALFRDQLARGDTTMLRIGDVSSEGKWLAEAGELPPDLDRELTSLQPGEITFPRPYEDGFRIVRLLEVYPAGKVLDLSAVRDEIVARLMFEQSRRRQDSLMTVLRERYPVRIFLKDS